MGKWLRRIGGIFLVLLTTPMLLQSSIEIMNCTAINQGDTSYYVYRSYSAGFGFFFISIVLLVMAFVLIKWPLKWGSPLLFALAFALAFFTGVQMPVQIRSGYGEYKVRSDLESTVTYALSYWLAKNTDLPANQSELDLALYKYLEYEHGEDTFLSPFARDGNRIPYKLVYVGNASGPCAPQTPAEIPGVIYAAFNENLDYVWLTATVLAKDVTDEVIYLKKPGGKGVEVVESSPKPMTVRPAYSVREITISPDGRWLAFDRGDLIKLWEVKGKSGLRTLEGHGSYILSLDFSPDSKLLASVSYLTVKLWDVSTGRELRSITRKSHKFKTATFSPDGLLMATGSDRGTVITWEVETGKALTTFHGHEGSIVEVQFSPDGSLLAADSGRDVTIWDVGTGEELTDFLSCEGSIVEVRFSPDGNLLAGSCGWGVTIWDVGAREPLGTLESNSGWVEALSFSPDGKCLALATDSHSRTIEIWDISNGRRLCTLPARNKCEFLYAFEFSPDGRWLTSTGDVIRMWNTSDWNQLSKLEAHFTSIYDIAFHPDSSLLAAGGHDRAVMLWEIDDAGHWVTTGTKLLD